MTETTDLNASPAPDTRMPDYASYPVEPAGGSDSETMLDFLTRRDAWFAVNAPARTACPPWCESPRDTHDFEMWTKDPHVWSRFHELASIGAGWGVSRQEIWRDGVVTLEAPEITWHGDDEPMTREQARQRGRDLQEAVRRATEIDDVLPDSLLTPEQVERELGIPVITLMVWREKRTGPRWFRLGGRLVYRRDEVNAWIAAHGTDRDAS